MLDLNPFIDTQAASVSQQKNDLLNKKGSAYSWDNIDTVKGSYGDQLRETQMRLKQMQALQTAFADPNWRNTLEGSLSASLAAQQNAASRGYNQSLGQTAVGMADRGLLGSGVDARARGDLASWLQGQKQSAAQGVEGVRQSALLERENQTRSILDRILSPDQIQGQAWDAQLAGYNDQARINQMLAGVNQQRMDATSQMLGSVFQGVGQWGQAGFQRASTLNAADGGNRVWGG